MAKIKICGVTNVEDAMLVTNSGAEYLGLNFFPTSARKVSEKMAKDIVGKLPPFILPVGIFCDAEIDVVVKTAKKCGLKLIQLHGAESPEYCKQIAEKTGLPIIKAFRMENESIIEQIKTYLDSISYILLDAFSSEEQGGTGQTFDWEWALQVKGLDKPIFLAGGLTPDNIKEAIEKVQPFAVDTASGVERLPRRKDYDRLTKFVRTVRGLKIT